MRLMTKLTLAASALIASAVTAPLAAANKPVDGNIGFQEPATIVMQELVKFHNQVFILISAIVVFVTVLMGWIMFRYSAKRNPVPSKTTHHVGLEIAWTIIPILALLWMVFPSMKNLYLQDRLPETELTIKVTGNTWNWTYEYPELEDKVEGFTSYLLPEEEAKAQGRSYLLAADTPLVVPVDTNVKVLVTSSANLHAFAVPAFGVKIDAVPGRINQTWFNVFKEGTFYGQCSELCGKDHAFMPIEVKVVSKAEFKRWVDNGGQFATKQAMVDGAAVSVE